MKKLLLTMVVTLAMCGSIFAQNRFVVEGSFWANNYYNTWEDQGALYASIMINDVPVETDNPYWDQLEVAAFVGDEIRTIGMYLTDEYLEYDLFPTINAEPIYFTSPGEVVTFMMYNHATRELYQVCEPVIWDGDPITILTGEEHWEGFDDPDHPLMLNFVGEPIIVNITKEIIGYNEEGGGWYLISSPMGNVDVAAVNNIDINDFDLYYFDQNGDEYGKEWMNYELKDEEGNFVAGFTTLEAGKGYLYANIATVTLEFPGTGYTGEGTFPLEYSEENEDETMHGWNLMGNPYNAVATVDRPFYRMESDAFAAYDEYEGVEIDPMEGVLVYTEAAGEFVTFTPAEAKVKPVLALNLSSNSKVLDRAVIGFGQGQRLPKIQFNRNSSKIYFTIDNKDYAIVRSEGMGEMPVNFKASENGSYTLSLSAENVDFAYLHLIDNLTGADQDLLANPSYTFEANTADYACRFKLVFATGNNDENFAFFSNGSLVINNEGNATLQVVDVTGRIIKCESINGCANVNIDAASGVYMVRLVNGDNVKVQKVVK